MLSDNTFPFLYKQLGLARKQVDMSTFFLTFCSAKPECEARIFGHVRKFLFSKTFTLLPVGLAASRRWIFIISLDFLLFLVAGEYFLLSFRQGIISVVCGFVFLLQILIFYYKRGLAVFFHYR